MELGNERNLEKRLKTTHGEPFVDSITIARLLEDE